MPSRIAVRVNGNLSYLLGDHLGSTSITTDQIGVLTAEMRYKAWGETRYMNGTTPSDYRYTSQREDAGIGLYFYNARWYDVTLSHFTQADTLIPNPGNALDWNRYAYVRYNPLRYVDPSGHTSVCARSNGDPECNNVDTWSLPFVDAQYGIVFDGEDWSVRNTKVVRNVVAAVANIFCQTINHACSGWDDHCTTLSSAEAFKSIYGNVFTFTWSNEQPGNAGYTNAYNHITLYSVKDSPNYLQNHMRVIVHELGHAFNQVIGKEAQTSLNAALLRDADGDHIDEYGRYYGFAGGWDNWQFGWDNTPSEVFADMFVGWVYNKWDVSHPAELGIRRMIHMNFYMPIWINR